MDKPLIDGATPSGSGCQPTASAADASSQSGIPSAKSIAFTDRDGNRFIFPSWIAYEDDPDAPSLTNLWWDATAICSRIVGMKHDTFAFDPAHFPHYRIDAPSAIFLHGAATVLLFAGPEFEAAQVTA